MTREEETKAMQAEIKRLRKVVNEKRYFSYDEIKEYVNKTSEIWQELMEEEDDKADFKYSQALMKILLSAHFDKATLEQKEKEFKEIIEKMKTGEV